MGTGNIEFKITWFGNVVTQGFVLVCDRSTDLNDQVRWSEVSRRFKRGCMKTHLFGFFIVLQFHLSLSTKDPKAKHHKLQPLEKTASPS